MTPQENKELDLPLAEEVPLPRMYEAGENKHFLEPLIILAKRKRFIFYFTLGAAVFSVALSLWLPVYFTANAKILPPQQGSSITSAMLDQLGGLGSLLGSVGGGLGLKNTADTYVAMLRSRAVTDPVIDKFHLMDVYKTKFRMDAEKRLENATDITARKDGVIEIAVEDRDPGRAKDIANEYIKQLEAVTKNLAVTDASKRRKFFEEETLKANEELGVAEEDLRRVQEKYGMIQLEGQAKVLMESEASLRAEVAAQEVYVQSLHAFATPQNPDLQRAEQQLAALQTQLKIVEQGQGKGASADALSRVPGAGLEYVRALRQVKFREKLLELMLRQYEAAHIDESKDAALVQTLDEAVVPEKKSHPKRAIICALLTLFGFVVAVSWSYFRESVERAKEDPNYLARLQLLKLYAFRRRKSVTVRD